MNANSTAIIIVIITVAVIGPFIAYGFARAISKAWHKSKNEERDY